MRLRLAKALAFFSGLIILALSLLFAVLNN